MAGRQFGKVSLRVRNRTCQISVVGASGSEGCPLEICGQEF